MGFGWPTRYLELKLDYVEGGAETWDDAVEKASTEYCKRMHNLFWDNCHSHVGMALTLMRYKNSTSWNMVKIAAWMFLFGRYVGVSGFLKTWLPFVILSGLILTLVIYTS
jgi:transmembrane protein 222